MRSLDVPFAALALMTAFSAIAALSGARRYSAMDYAGPLVVLAALTAFFWRVIAPAWTDHNTHDPGVTLLELLAYGVALLAVMGHALNLFWPPRRARS
ncbi:MAG: hypothetical protein GC189_12080 [Alphaproteobacteria bacterium]|nr:hypothetical protein [Alphaproteobacteria bacterium]